MRLLIVAGAAACVAGCASSYAVTKVGPDGAIGAGAGVPVTLGRPEFSLKKVEGADPDRYQVLITYVPDPDNRYTVRLAPALLSNATFDLALSEQGAISSIEGDTQQQVGPAIKAAADFATKAMSAAATLSALSLSPVQPGKAFDYTDCLQAEAPSRIAQCAISHAPGAGGCTKAASASLSARLSLMTPKEDKGEGLATLYGATTEETACLKEAGENLQSAVDAVADNLDTNYRARLPGSDKGVRETSAKALKAAAAGKDLKAARRLVYGVAYAQVPGGGTRPLEKALGVAANSVTAGDVAAIAAALDAVALSAAKGLGPVEVIQRGARAAKALADAATLAPGPWRQRAVANLQAQIREDERALLMVRAVADGDAAERRRNAQARAQIEARLLARRRALAAHVNMEAPFERLLKLEALLAQPPRLDSAGRQSASAEYVNYRKEADAIAATLDARIQTALATAKADKAGELPLQVAWVSDACRRRFNEDTVRYAWGPDAPRFVVVLSRGGGGAPIQPPASARPPELADIPECAQ